MHALNECSFTEGNIRMKNKEKAPFSRGAYYVVRNPQERVPLTQLFPDIILFAERRHLDAERESTPFSVRRVLKRT